MTESTDKNSRQMLCVESLPSRVEPYWVRVSDVLCVGLQKYTHPKYHPVYWWAKLYHQGRIKYFRLGTLETFESAKNMAETLVLGYLAKPLISAYQISDFKDGRNYFPVFFSFVKESVEEFVRPLGQHASVTFLGKLWIAVIGDFSRRLEDLNCHSDLNTDYMEKIVASKKPRLFSIFGLHHYYDPIHCQSGCEGIVLFNVPSKAYRRFNRSDFESLQRSGYLKENNSEVAIIYAARIQAEVLAEMSGRPSTCEDFALSRQRSESDPYQFILTGIVRDLEEEVDALAFHQRHCAETQHEYHGVYAPYGRQKPLFGDRPDEWRYNFDPQSPEFCECGSRLNRLNFRCAWCLGEICFRCGVCSNRFGNRDIPNSSVGVLAG